MCSYLSSFTFKRRLLEPLTDRAHRPSEVFFQVVLHCRATMSRIDAAVTVGNQIADLLPTHRQCTIHITNKCSNYILSSPSIYMNSGFCAEILPPTIDSSSPGRGLFSKTANTARGAVGVFTYDLLNKQTKGSTEKIAVMFSVPYDFNMYANWFAGGIFDKSTACDYDLYDLMYNKTDKGYTREKADTSLKYTNGQVTILATMSDSYQPVMMVEVSDD